MRKVAIVGAGMTKFGEHWGESFREMIVRAGIAAMRDARITAKDIEAIYGGNMSAGRFIHQEHIASLIADHTGLAPVPCVRVESACASGGVALRQGYIDIASGMHDLVVVGGAEKMTDVSTDTATEVLATAADQEWEAFYGITFPAAYALIARRHMHEYGTTEEQLAHVAVKNHKNGAMNPDAQFQFEVTLEQVMESPVVASPLKLLDCSPLTDGAATVILASEEKAKQLTKDPIWIQGSGHATDSIALHDRQDICTLRATIESARQAYKQANLTPKDIDFAEVHDCFSIAEICAIEDLGFFKKGEGGKATAEGQTALGGKIAINASGGLKAKGHPVGATGVAQAVETYLQLQGRAGKRQAKDAEIGLTHNVGGSGGTAVVHIFGRDKR